jgi:hypothetical protein
MVLVPIGSDLAHLVEPTPDREIEPIRRHFGRLLPFVDIQRLRAARTGMTAPAITVDEVLEMVAWEDLRWLMLRNLGETGPLPMGGI